MKHAISANRCTHSAQNAPIRRQNASISAQFWRNAGVLTACSLTMSVAGMGLRVYQTSIIGAEGMGLLQLLLSVYYFATNLAVSGCNLAATRLLSERAAPVRCIMRKCLALCVGCGTAAGAGLYGAAPLLGEKLLGDARTVPSLRILALGLPLLAISCCCRGYFLAVRRTVCPSLGQVVEQMTVWLGTAAVLPLCARRGLTASCCAIAAAMTAGELAGNLWIVFFTRKSIRTRPPYRDESARHDAVSTRQILHIAAPVALGYDLRSALIAVENVLVPAGLKQCGRSYAESLASYGVVKGMALPTVQFPAAFLTAFSLLLIPEVAQSRAAGRPDEIRAMAQRVFRLCLAFSTFVTGGFLVFGNELGQILYCSADAGRAMRILCPLAPLMYLDSIVDAMLKGLDEQVYSLKVNLSDSCIRIVLMIVLLPRFGIGGYLAALTCSIVYNSLLSITRLVRQSGLRVRFWDWLVCPALCAAVACLSGRAVGRLLPWTGTLQIVAEWGFSAILCAFANLLYRSACDSENAKKSTLLTQN